MRLQTKGFHFYEGDQKWVANGIAYGPFQPDSTGQPYPDPARIRDDFSAMSAIEINSIRLYECPGESLATIAAEYDLRLLLDVPWPKHLDLYDSPRQQSMCMQMLDERLARVKDWPNIQGILLGNEIPPDLVRWAGPRKVNDFLRRLYDRAKSIAPDLLFGYANFPSTEFLQPRFFDFLGFNVYLNSPEVLRRYLTRLRLMYPEKPLVLTEIGFDSLGQGETEQALLLHDSLLAAREAGCAGSYVFSWTDEWHTGGFDVTDWAFGVVTKHRQPKPALESVARVFAQSPRAATEALPMVSVVVATYNGGRTLRQCLDSLAALNYPNYETIVVDDGSTDNTSEILSDFPDIQIVRQPNMGLSEARNSGIRAARGDIVAFTDSDCVVDPDWLDYLVSDMIRGNFAGIGGPNLTPPEDRIVARAIALAPGHATHVLLNEYEAEHVPGCNMAFSREALLEIGGFNPIFRKAGDDVDVIWRLQDLGYKIGFSTGGFVWHHRRPTLKAYLRQQVGYGEAESQLLRKHPHRFNDRGQSIWNGVIYSSSETTAAIGGPNIHYGVFGTAGFQCVYDRPASLLSYVFTSIEWWIVCGCLILLGMFWPSALQIGIAGALAALAISGLKAWRRCENTGAAYRILPLTWLLWALQPVYRAGARYWFRWRSNAPPVGFLQAMRKASHGQPYFMRSGKTLRFWTEDGPPRVEVLQRLVEQMQKLNWLFTPNNGWEKWDLAVVISWWFKIRLLSAEEDHGQRKRLLKIRLDLVPTSIFRMFICVGVALCLIVFWHNTIWARILVTVLLLITWAAYRQANQSRALVATVLSHLIDRMGFIPLGKYAKEPEAKVTGALAQPDRNTSEEQDVPATT